MRLASPYDTKTIELVKLAVVDEGSVFEIREKFLRLFSYLSHDSFYTTYAATLFSDICRAILGCGSADIEVGIQTASKPHFLKFSFPLGSSESLERRMVCFFDNVKIQAKSKNNSVDAFLKLPEDRLTRKTLKEIENILSIRSKEELYRELEKTYTQLSASQKMAQLEKMSAVGTLSAGIAHELNNPLMGIINFVQYCIKHTPPEDKRHAILEDAKRESLRCVELIQNLLSFSRLEESGPEDLVTEELNLVPVVNEVLKLLLYRIETEKVRVVHDKNASVNAPVNRNQIKQVLLNIISNALDAMKTVRTKVLEVSFVKEDSLVSLMIKDTGTGIPSDAIGKIFDPFFTTKPTGQGTGLGLSITQNIIKKHSGEIKVNSERGKGTSFDIRLPLTRGRVYA